MLSDGTVRQGLPDGHETAWLRHGRRGDKGVRLDQELVLSNRHIASTWQGGGDYSPWFSDSKKVLEIRSPSERASQEEQNSTNFSFIAPSSEEL